MDSSTLYARRVNSILMDEDYGPALARLNARDTATVLGHVRSGDLRRARTEITRLDAQRRSDETHKRDRRRRDAVRSHVQRQLAAENVYYNMGTVSLGVSLMTRDQITETMGMNGAEIRDHAGDYTLIRMYAHLSTTHNVWWYH